MQMTWLRRIAIVLGVLVALIIAAAAVLVATFDANRYKGLAIDWMKSERQRTLAIDGPIRLSLFPRLAIEVSKVRLSEHGRADEFLAVDEAALAVAVLPLLRKQVVVDRISARGVRAVYTRDAKGVRNIDDLVGAAGTATPATPSPSAGSGTVVRFDVSAVKLEDVQLRVRDAMAKIDGTVALQSLSSGRLAWDGAALHAGALKLALKSATLGADTLGASTLAVKQLVFDTGGPRLALDALQVALSGRRGADMPFEATLDWPQLAVDAHSLKGSALSGQVKTTGPIALAGDFRSGAPSGSFDAMRLPGVTLTLQGQARQRKVDGTWKSDVVVHAGRGAVALDAIDLKANLSDPGLQPLALTVRGKAHADAKAASWTFDGALSGNRFESTGQAALGGTVPNIKANARFDSLDLNKVLAPDKPAATPAPSGPAPADTPVALDGLKAVNGQFHFTAGALAFRQYRISDVKVDATLDNGTLRIGKLAGRAWGGTVDGSGSAEANSRRVAVKLAADGVDVNALL
ncbi:MAG TPA: AsmA family protein, partial [Burkholderiaceae bacterium]|nr:AsmA family protein [Burkholderiaceae bacterium]